MIARLVAKVTRPSHSDLTLLPKNMMIFPKVHYLLA
jgi:hypothetical protein